MKKHIVCIILITVFTVSCATTDSLVQFRKSDKMVFYIVGNDRLQLNDVLATELKEIGYDAQIVLNVDSIINNNRIVKESSGTGFFVSNDGLVVTCAHVVEGAKTIETIINGQKYELNLFLVNKSTDLAILKINKYNPGKFFSIGKFNNQNLGDKIFVLGYPLSNILGSEIRITDGIISSKSGIESDQTYFQISAPIQPGNSGGPIITENFDVIGVAAARLSDALTIQNTGVIPQNINFGVKSDYLLIMNDDLNNIKSNINTLQDTFEATIQLLINQGNDNVVSNDQEYIIILDYDYYWDTQRLKYLYINIYNKNGALVGQGRQYGGTFLGPKADARALISEIISKIK